MKDAESSNRSMGEDKKGEILRKGVTRWRSSGGSNGMVLVSVMLVCSLFRNFAHGVLCQHQWDINDCMECEKIQLDGNTRILSFCKLPDTTATSPERRREVSVRDVFWNPEKKQVASNDEGMFVWKWKPVLRECLINATLQELRREDFLMQVQYATYKLPSIDCNRIADRLCERLGYGKTNWTELPLSMCCALTNSSNEWTLTNEKMWHCECGSGVRRNHEGCDDGNLDTKDGCNKFCQVESDLGYSCREPVVDLDYTAPKPPSRKSVCQCSCDCSLACTCQNKANRDFCRVRDDGSLVDDPDTICCPPYVER